MQLWWIAQKFHAVCFLNLITKHYNFLAVLSKTACPSMQKSQILFYIFCRQKVMGSNGKQHHCCFFIPEHDCSIQHPLESAVTSTHRCAHYLSCLQPRLTGKKCECLFARPQCVCTRLLFISALPHCGFTAPFIQIHLALRLQRGSSSDGGALQTGVAASAGICSPVAPEHVVMVTGTGKHWRVSPVSRHLELTLWRGDNLTKTQKQPWHKVTLSIYTTHCLAWVGAAVGLKTPCSKQNKPTGASGNSGLAPQLS